MSLFALMEEEVTEPAKPITVLLENPSLDKVEAAWKYLDNCMKTDPNFCRQKIHVQFAEPVKVQVDSRNVKEMQSANLKFFISTGGSFCYTFHSRTGYWVTRLPYQKITAMTIYPQAWVDGARLNKIRSIIKRIHPNAWDDIKKRPVEEFAHYGTSLLALKGRVPEYVLKQLEVAFAEKKDFRWSRDGQKRDWTIETKLGEDGVFRAWFSSEYAGCGNGGYYLLIQPGYAWLCEYD